MPESSYEVLLLVNNSTDATACEARRFAREHPRLRLEITERTFPAAAAHIGNVRRTLMEMACGRLEGSIEGQGAILSTDADTEVAPDWIAQNLHAIAAGADAVGGLIQLHTHEVCKLPARICRMQKLDDDYRTLVAWLEDRLDPLAHDRWPRHYHHFGASFAVTVEAYRTAGGLPPERSLEDVAFYQALMRKDQRFRHSPAVKVRTSARLDGRTAIGLSEQLNQWAAGEHAGAETPVDSVRLLTLRFTARRAFRELWESKRLADRTRHFAERTQAAAERVGNALDCQTFGEAWEVLALDPLLKRRLGPTQSKSPIGSAIHELRALSRQLVTPEAELFSEEDQCDTSALSPIAV